MKRISLTKGKFAIVDDKNFEYLSQWKWYAQKAPNTFYAARENREGKHIFMHRLILDIPKGEMTDHKNHNGLDNRECNIRICTQQQNCANSQLNQNSQSGYKGVSQHSLTKKWRARIMVNYKEIHLGLFDSKKEAAKVYNMAANKYNGEFAYKQAI